jgi:hypothetical protein
MLFSTHGTGDDLYASTTCTAEFDGVKRRGSLPGFAIGYLCPILTGQLFNVSRAHPCAGDMLSELPGMTLLTSPVASGLIDRKIMLGTGEMGRFD